MEEAKAFLKNLIHATDSKNKIFIRNILKEYLQAHVLDFVYSHPKYSQLVFYGGSCLAHCHGLPRLSEDLDFIDLRGEIEIRKFAKDVQMFFKKNTDLNISANVQKFRVYLKFPILHELGVTHGSETDLLFLKVEIFQDFKHCSKYAIDTIPIFKFNKSILVKTFDLPTLMSTKIRAVLYRKWEKKSASGKILAKVKGRDYFDLMWYLEKAVKPNLGCIVGIESLEALKAKLLKIVDTVDARSIQYDLEALIDNENFIKNLSKNIKEILKRKISAL
ncbi:MAG: hypothetical protein US74_C0045G0004 [Parcubacteria group bacterium GW2011_GWA2_38_13]|nr:MAG: hypothetical protein US74_C0045G0004 [Parcubacteria group bacterium GW2011_GWA2_38_13]